MDVSRETMDCVYLDVDIRGEMNATTAHEIIVTAEEYSVLKNAKAEVECNQQWKANLLPDKIVHGTKSGEILCPLEVQKGRLRELPLMREHNIYEIVKKYDGRGGLPSPLPSPFSLLLLLLLFLPSFSCFFFSLLLLLPSSSSSFFFLSLLLLLPSSSFPSSSSPFFFFFFSLLLPSSSSFFFSLLLLLLLLLLPSSSSSPFFFFFLVFFRALKLRFL